MTMVCPRCQVAYQGGQVCPSCGTYLVPYQPLPQPPIQQPMYEYSPEPACEAAEAPVASASPSKGRTTVAIAVLSVLVALLTALCGVLLLRPAPEPEVVEKVVEVPLESSSANPSEQAAVDSGWEYLHGLFDVFVDMHQLEEGTAEWEALYENLMTAIEPNEVQAFSSPIVAMSDEYPELVFAWEKALAARMTVDQLNNQAGVEGLSAYIHGLSSYMVAANKCGFDTSDWEWVEQQ